MGLHLSQIVEADELLTNDPLALLVGLVLDQRGSERTNIAPVAGREDVVRLVRPGAGRGLRRGQPHLPGPTQDSSRSSGPDFSYGTACGCARTALMSAFRASERRMSVDIAADRRGADRRGVVALPWLSSGRPAASGTRTRPRRRCTRPVRCSRGGRRSAGAGFLCSRARRRPRPRRRASRRPVPS